MKKFLAPFLSALFVFCLVFGPVSAVSADYWEPPTVTPLTGDKDFTFKTANPTDPAFTTLTDNGIIVPAGFPLGQKQFGGEIAFVKGLVGGTARLCFSFPNYRYGWDGSIFVWDGTRWTPMASTLTEGTEGGPASVCTTINADGTYALIIGFAHPEKSMGDLPPCSEDFDAFVLPFYVGGDEETFETISVFFLVLNQEYPEGTPISYRVMNITPPGSITGALYQRGSVFMSGAPFTVVSFFRPDDLDEFWEEIENPEYEPPSYTHITFHYLEGWEELAFSVRVTTPTCYKDFDVDDFFGTYGGGPF